MLMKATLIAGLVAAGVSSAALADEDKVHVGAVPTSGFTATKIKPDDGGYKVKGVDANGQKQKYHVDASGAVTTKHDNDD